jgi:hypothetical protein
MNNIPNTRQAVHLPPGKTAEAVQISLPSHAALDASSFAHLFESGKTAEVQELSLNAHLQNTQDRMILVHASASSSSPAGEENRLANDVVQADQEASPNAFSRIRGSAFIFYQRSDRDFLTSPDWEALHDTCYASQLASRGKAGGSSGTAELAKQFQKRRDQARKRQTSSSKTQDANMKGEEAEINHEEQEEAWTDEEVEKPREPKKEIESDDEEGDNKEADAHDDDEEEDSEGSYEDESELESDDEDDPRKKALLEMIQAAIMKDGKLDLDR